MKAFKLESKTHGIHEVLVDDEDWPLIQRHRWTLKKIGKTFYVTTTTRDRKYLHRLIMDCGSLKVDHVDRNGLNNQRNNLRICTAASNAWNAEYQNSVAGYRGIWKNTNGVTWGARIRVNGKRIYLGCFETAELAAAAYDEAATKYHGEFAELNNVS